MFDFLSPNNIYQVVSNFGIFVLIAISLVIFRRIRIGKDGLSVEKDERGNNITLKTINNKLEERFEKIEKEFAEMKQNDIGQSLDILRINFYLQKQPDETKLISGLRYLRNKGNGRTRDDIKSFISAHQELYNSIIVIDPSLRIEE